MQQVSNKTIVMSPLLYCGAVLYNCLGDVLLTNKKFETNIDTWDLPRGLVSHMEPLEMAIIRLFDKSFGYLIYPHRIMSVSEIVDTSSSTHALNIIYSAALISSKGEHKMDDGCKMAWYSTHNLPETLSVSAAAALR